MCLGRVCQSEKKVSETDKSVISGDGDSGGVAVERERQTDRQMAADKCFQAQLKGDYFDGLLLSCVCESVRVCE